LISAASSALSLTIHLKAVAYEIFTDKKFIDMSASAISMAFLAYILSVGIVSHDFSMQTSYLAHFEVFK
jgi:exosome complex RNA-binding protein Rrp42 (RNase PH superfamily)